MLFGLNRRLLFSFCEARHRAARGRDGSLSLFANANIATFSYFAKQNTDFLALFFYANISFATNCLLTFNIIIGRVAEGLGDRIA